MSEPIVLPKDPRWGIETLIDAATGKVTDKFEIAHAAIHVAGYALGLFHDHPPVFSAFPTPDTVEECCKAVEILSRHSLEEGKVGAIDWNALVLQLLPLALKILELLTKKSA